MLPISVKKGPCYRKQKIKSFGNHQEFLSRIAKSLYYVDLPQINCTSLPVTELASEIFSEANKFSLNRLDIEKAAHLSRNACVSPCLLVLALLYLERLKASNPKYLSNVSPTELFLISLLVGSKFLQDDGEGDELSNTEWADLTGLSVQEINEAEKHFLNAINWEVFVSKEQFWKRFNLLESKVGLRQGCNRGWFTYTELSLLLKLIDLTTVTQCFWNVTVACLLSYAASVLTLVGSALLVGQIPGLGLKAKPPSMTEVANDWTNASLPSVGQNLIPPSNGLEDCNVSSLEQLTDLNQTEFLDLCQPAYNNPDPGRGSNEVSDFFQELYLHLNPTRLLDVGTLIIENCKETNSALLFAREFSVWTWSDYVKNFLVENSFSGARNESIRNLRHLKWPSIIPYKFRVKELKHFSL